MFRRVQKLLGFDSHRTHSYKNHNLRPSLLLIFSQAFLGTSKHLPTWAHLVQYPRRLNSF